MNASESLPAYKALINHGASGSYCERLKVFSVPRASIVAPSRALNRIAKILIYCVQNQIFLLPCILKRFQMRLMRFNFQASSEFSNQTESFFFHSRCGAGSRFCDTCLKNKLQKSR